MPESPVELIDVIWLQRGSPRIVCAFEAEQSTSIYSGILRMKDLALSLPDRTSHFYLVAPESREREVLAQMQRPALNSAAEEFSLGYLPAGELREQCDAMCRFGVDHSVLLKVARCAGLPAESRQCFRGSDTSNCKQMPPNSPDRGCIHYPFSGSSSGLDALRSEGR